MPVEIKNRLEENLKKHDYEAFITIIIDLNVTYENYEEFLNIINSIIVSQMKDQNEVISYGGNSEDKLLRVFNESEEKSFFEWIPDLRSAIKKIFEIKLNSYIDENIEDKLENFERRFM